MKYSKKILSLKRDSVVLFTIITPTIGRESLLKTCESVDAQTFTDYQHLVCYDGPKCDLEILKKVVRPGRKILFTGMPRLNDYGHSLRYLAWDVADKYLMYLDDDDYYDPECLEILVKMMDPNVDFIFFPVMWHGNPCMFEPPRTGYTVSCQYCHKKVGADGSPIRFRPGGFGTDGHWLDDMLHTNSYQVIKPYKPLVYVDAMSSERD